MEVMVTEKQLVALRSNLTLIKKYLKWKDVEFAEELDMSRQNISVWRRRGGISKLSYIGTKTICEQRCKDLYGNSDFVNLAFEIPNLQGLASAAMTHLKSVTDKDS